MGRSSYTAFQEILPDGATITVYPDQCAPNPRKEFSQLGRMFCWHRRYDLGDEHSFRDPDAFEAEFATIPHLRLPLYLYDHSGITMSTTPFSCRWDSGQVGWIVVTHNRLRDEYARKRMSKGLLARAAEALRSEVAEYDQYLQGDVWVLEHLDPDDKVIDALGGIFGEDYAIQEAKEWLANAQAVA
jgi:hypothetical protein